jgi:hypothetical protein
MTPEDWKLLATVVLPAIPSVITIAALRKWYRSVHTVDKAMTTALRIGPLVEGNTEEHNNDQIRKGLIGRVKDLEASVVKKDELIANQTDVIEDLAGKLRAVLRGLGLPSDISDNVRLEKEIKKRASETRYPIDHLGARLEMTGERQSDHGHERTGPHPQLVERVPRPDPPRRPALMPRRPTGSGALRDPRDRREHSFDERKGSFDERRDPTYPPPDSDDEEG